MALIAAFLTLESTGTGSAGTAEWRTATKNMVIAGYVGGSLDNTAMSNASEDDEPLVGAHLREAVTTLKSIFRL